MRPRMPIQKKPSEYAEKLLEVRRVSRVMAGGKRMSFRAIAVLGNKKGKVGVGIGKGLDVAAAVAKAQHNAKKNMILIPLKDQRTIHYDSEAKFGAARVRLKPARPNHGLIAGSACRAVLELAGIKDISAKILGRTTNKLNNARATIKALQMIKIKDEGNKKVENST